MHRESWKSRVGFTFAALGSAVGLANICLFPYLVGKNGGAAFVAVYLICLVVVGFPVFISEILLGRTAKSSPYGAFKKIGRKRFWLVIGKMTVLTGFMVTSFYSVLAGWVIGYLVEAIKGNLGNLNTADDSLKLFNSLTSMPWWGLFFHGVFMLMCVGIVYGGVRRGIERCSKLLMPALIFLLMLLVVRGLSLPHAWDGVRYLFSPDWSELTPMAILLALGQAFFTLSLGQGTMITYGSYLSDKDNIPGACIPIALGDTVISLCAAIVVFTTVFSVGMEPSQGGPGLLFQTLPLVFAKLPLSRLMAVLFFLFVALAAVTSEISAMEPVVAYFVDEKKWKRSRAVILCGLGGFTLGIPSALSYGLLSSFTLFGMNFMDAVQFAVQSIMLPLGGFLAVILVGWVWGFDMAMKHLKQGGEHFFARHPWFEPYIWFCIKYSAPILIILVFINQFLKA